MYLTENSTKTEMLDAIYSDLDLIDHFIKASSVDPENMDAADIYAEIQRWIEAGDECTSAA